ncbi:copper transporter 2-like [Coffea eugenioides]|uniref:copper transporter 2-like n=1 Tax=Coffea eugenioides TaxID=49369 RepID=UPI000F6143AC|nr:copper transporter 2-like [Coffea eugenioides]XP_027156210.1 copper transporter 2-like [Coffea eugenioides]
MAIDALPIHHNTTAPPPPPPPPTNVHRHHPFSLFTHFYWGKDAEILFSGWPAHNSAMYALALLFVFFSAILQHQRFQTQIQTRSRNSFPDGDLRNSGKVRVSGDVVHDSYNGGIFIAVVVSHAIGYVVFGSLVSIFRKDVEKAKAKAQIEVDVHNTRNAAFMG